jgi:hypothetical protein
MENGRSQRNNARFGFCRIGCGIDRNSLRFLGIRTYENEKTKDKQKGSLTGTAKTSRFQSCAILSFDFIEVTRDLGLNWLDIVGQTEVGDNNAYSAHLSIVVALAVVDEEEEGAA